MSFTPINDTTSVRAELHSRYGSGRSSRSVRTESSLRVIARSLRSARRHEEGASHL